MGKLFNGLGRWIGKGLKNPLGAFTAGNLASDWFKLGVYKPNNPPQSPVHNNPSDFNLGGMSMSTKVIIGVVLLLLLLRR